MKTLTKNENNLLQSLRDLELHGAGAYLIGALSALEAIANGAGDNLATILTTPATTTPTTTTTAKTTTRAKTSTPTVDDDQEETTEPLAEISEAVETARSDRRWPKIRRLVSEGIWEPGLFSDLVDRFAAGIILKYIPTTVGTSIINAIKMNREKHPGFKGYPFVANRLRAAFRAAGYNWTPLESVLEPAPAERIKKELVETSRGVFSYSTVTE